MLTIYRPFSMFKDINQALDDIWNHDVQKQVDYFSKLSEDDSSYYLKITAPGFKKEEINVEVKDGILTVFAEHKEEEKKENKSFRSSTSSFERSFKLPKGINVDSTTAEYKSGILIISFKKAEIKESVKKINVSCSE